MCIMMQQAPRQNSLTAQGWTVTLHLEGTRDGVKELPIILPVALYKGISLINLFWVFAEAFAAGSAVLWELDLL
jgi:hypothetical protein